jgi:hypothetical protein
MQNSNRGPYSGKPLLPHKERVPPHFEPQRILKLKHLLNIYYTSSRKLTKTDPRISVGGTLNANFGNYNLSSGPKNGNMVIID